MLYARGGTSKGCSVPTKIPLFSSNKVTSKKSKELWTKSPEWNNAAYEEKEKSPYFTNPVQDTTNSHPILTKRERMEPWEKKETHAWSKQN